VEKEFLDTCSATLRLLIFHPGSANRIQRIFFLIKAIAYKEFNGETIIRTTSLPGI
jgi:hypothetical protein